MMVAAGTAVSGTGASTVRIPSTESVDTILVASILAGSLKTTERCLHTSVQCQCVLIIKLMVILYAFFSCQKQTFSAAFLPADWCLKCLKLWIFHRLQASVFLAYLYFLVKHLAINPCSSGLSSCFPGDGLPFMGKNLRTHKGIKLHRETTQHKNLSLPQSCDVP